MYSSQASVKRQIKKLHPLCSVLESHLWDIAYSAYPQRYSHVDIQNYVCNRDMPPYGFLWFDVHTPQSVFECNSTRCDLFFSPELFKYAPSDVFFSFSPFGTVYNDCKTWHNLVSLFYELTRNFSLNEDYDFTRSELRIGFDMALAHISVKMSYHHYRYYVTYYGFTFGDESDCRDFVQHVVYKGKSVEDAREAYRKLILDFWSYALSVPRDKA